MCVFAFYIKIIITFYREKINLSIWQILLRSFVPFVQDVTTCIPSPKAKSAVKIGALIPRKFLLFFLFFC